MKNEDVATLDMQSIQVSLWTKFSFFKLPVLAQQVGEMEVFICAHVELILTIFINVKMVC